MRSLNSIRLAAVFFFAGLSPTIANETFISLDVCADQYLLALATDSQIAALSANAVNSTSTLRKRALNFPRHRGDIETLVSLQPDAVISLWPAAPDLRNAIEKRGMRHIVLDSTPTLSSSFTNLTKLGELLGSDVAAERLVADARSRLSALTAGIPETQLEAIYVTPGGVSAGSNTFIDALFSLAGLRNGTKGIGWPAVRLEELVVALPDVVVRGFVDLETNHANYWGLFGHSVWARIASRTATIDLPGASVSCANWQALDAIARLIEGQRVE